MAWKCCCEPLDDERGAQAADTRLFTSRRPEPTGDARADAMAAAIAEYFCQQRGLPSPTWLAEPRVSRPFWFVCELPAFQAASLRESPPSFAVRGIFVTRADLMRA